MEPTPTSELPPPPPYEEVVGVAAEPASIATPSGDDLEVTVANPHKQSDGYTTFIMYKVMTRTSHPEYPHQPYEVARRFRDFDWLACKLADSHPGVIIPALPEKNAMQKFSQQADFIEERRQALQVFLTRVVKHPILRDASDLRTFLTASEHEWATATAGSKQVAGAASAAVSNLGSWFRSLGQTASTLVAGQQIPEVSENHDYLRLKEYISGLEGHLNETHRQAGRLVKKELDLGAAIAEFGTAAEILGKFDESKLGKPFGEFQNHCMKVYELKKQGADELSRDFQQPFKDFSRSIGSVQATISQRATALTAHNQAKLDHKSKQAKLSQLQYAAAKQDRISAAEQEVAAAEQKVAFTRALYDTLVGQMTEELNRFQKERAAEMTDRLKQFTVSRARSAAAAVNTWNAFLEDSDSDAE